MITNKFQDLELSRLGFGTMRLPQKADGSIDREQVEVMTEYALSHGINYFDTAYPYHGGQSEIAIGEALKKYPRDSFCLATKYPGHQIASSYDPAAVFEDQLKKCGVEYFDFYLLHNVYEHSIKAYTDPRWGIVEYFKEQKRRGRIRHLGFSCHGRLNILEEFLDQYGEDMEFCQIQLNYLDWTLQNGKEKYEILTKRGIPVWVMEPVRGGRLVNLKPEEAEVLKELRPEESIASWGFRFLMGLPNVKMILSGMSNLEQMKDNVATFEREQPLTEKEQEALLTLAEGMKNSVPCTGCRYCCEGCPKGLDIPMLLSVYNEMKFAASTNVSMRLDALEEEKLPAACVACGKCAKTCPQQIAVPEKLKELNEMLSKIPSWKDICRQRDEIERKRKEEQGS